MTPTKLVINNHNDSMSKKRAFGKRKKLILSVIISL